MPKFESIQQELNKLNQEIKQVEVEMEFSKVTNSPLNLKIKPIYLVGLLIAVFLVEVISAFVNKGYTPNIWLYCLTGALIIAYVCYFSFAYVQRSKSNKEQMDIYQTKKAIYESLCRHRLEVFETFVNQTNGVIMYSAEDNLKHYLWFEEDVLLIVLLKLELDITQIPYDQIKYISCDERLFDYNKFLGAETTVSNEVPYSYIFTQSGCYMYYTQNYESLVKLIPQKELLYVLEHKDSSNND